MTTRQIYVKLRGLLIGAPLGVGHHDMGNRREPRIPLRMAVTVSGADGDGTRFVQTAYASDVSRSGARLEGVGTLIRIGAKINVKDKGKQAKFCVVWIREARPSQPDH